MSRREVLPMVVADLEARVRKGTAEYGEPLRTNNGRDALWDAYEEALDLAMYLRQAWQEQQDANVLPEEPVVGPGARR